MRVISIFVLLLITNVSLAQKSSILKEPKVDKRVELLSIIFRLAENHEYSSEKFKLYTDKIWAHYEPYKNHELIHFAKEMRNEKGVGFDAVMSMAIHLDDQFNPKVPFTENVPDPRWGKEDAYTFTDLLKKFYVDSESETFFKENKNLYSEALTRFQPVYEHLDLKWYKDFYGKEPNEKFVIVNALGNGGGNYGRYIDLPNGEREVYAIMGTWKTDSTGMAEYSLESHFPTLLHEFNHSFVNYLLDQNPQPFRENGELIYEVVQEEMRRGGYANWQTMLNEGLVRAAVIKYMKDHNFSEEKISNEVREQLSRGFIWIEDLVTELENYDSHRETYPTLESYFPELVKAYSTYARNIHSLARKNQEEKARFHSISEFQNGDTDVDPNLSQISINFDKPFAGSNFIRPGENGNAFPDFRNLKYSEDRKTVMLEWVLKENTEYEFILIDLAPNGQSDPSDRDVEISFKTR